ncbi:acetolactate synthase small subunit [Anaeromicrobium sediminis]|nr:acetolactate synthase small subunit [Anaeromicrobium sediminis]
MQHFKEEIKINRRVLSVLVENQSGVLSKIAGLFSRRGYNIDSLSVGETENPKISRMTITIADDDYIIEQITKQLYKLIPVIKVIELKPDNAVYRELVLVKIKTTLETRASLIETTNIFRGKIIDVSKDTMTVELTGDSNKISAYIEMITPYGIVEFVRSGFAGLQRGNIKITD